MARHAVAGQPGRASMEFVIAGAIAAAAGIAGFFILRRTRPANPPKVEFVCRNCGEKHCECENKPGERPQA